ncbi:MAG: DNA cytosine methyltransferase [Bacteroidales bacterium]|nr:DNA cytosine methyltransferase [Bacteroidales bacterium]
MPKKKHTFIDLFAGCGGLSLGLEQAGFAPCFVNEIVETFCQTYKENHNLSEDRYYVGDINELNQEIDKFSPLFKDVTLVCGGPPCQGFSMANRQRVIDDPRNQLYKAFLQFLSKVRPQFFIMENVKGMMNKIDEIEQNYKDFLGDEYAFAYDVLRAQDFGVPQNRERLIFIGNRVGVNPKMIFEEIYKQKRISFVLRDALIGLPHLESKTDKGQKDIENDLSGFTVRDFEYIQNDFYHFINGEKVLTKLFNHKNRYNNPRDIEIYRRLPQGANSLHESIVDIMPYKSRNDIFKDKYFKLDENQICKTITSHMKYDCNMYIHPWEARGLSPREAARIQTFPDDFVFTGAQNQWYAQIGNAVPVKLAKAIGEGIMKFIEK